MADTRLTPLEITRRFLAVFHSNCVICKNMNHDYEKNFGDNQSGFDGQKIGPTLNIREPIQTTVRKTWTMAQQDVTETYKTLTVDQIRGVDLKFSDADLALSIDDFQPRYIDSPAKKLASVVDQYCAQYMLDRIPNASAFAALAMPTNLSTFLDAAAKMKASLVPYTDGINCAINPLQEATTVQALSGQYNPQGNISEMFLKGQMSNAAGLDWYMSQILPSITVGSLTNTSPVVGTFVAASSTSVPYTGGTSSGALTAGQTFTIADLYDVNYETKTTLGQLKQFVVASSTPSTTTGTITIYAMQSGYGIVFDTTSPFQNCYVSGGSINGKAIVFGALAGTTSVATTASATYQQNLLWHKDSFAFASVPLIVPKGLDMAARVTVDNLSFRFLRGYDVVNARMLSRMDIFFGVAELRNVWAAKVLTV